MGSLKFVATVFTAAVLVAAQPALAATLVWDGGAGTANWADANNWSSNTVPVAGDSVQFNSAVTTNANLGSVAIASIIFAAGSAGAIINGALTINAGAAQFNIDDQATGLTTTQINAAIAAGNGTMWLKSRTSGHVLEFRGAISAAAGGDGIRIYGPGTIRFNRDTNNTYTGTTIVASADTGGGNGLLQLAGNAQAVVPGNLVVGVGSAPSSAADRPQVQWLISQVLADTSRVTVGPDGLLALNASSETIGQLTGTGTVTSNSTLITLTVGDTGNFTWGGVMSGAGNVNKVGTGTMTYTAANTYTGLTTVSNGTLVLNAGNNIRAIQGPLTIGDGIDAANTAIVQIANDYQINRNASGAPTIINSDGTFEMVSSRDDLGAVTLNGGNIVLGASSLTVFGGLTMNGGTVAGAGSGNLRMMSNVVATATGALGPATINSLVVLLSPTTSFTVNAGSAQPELTIGGTVRTDAVARNITKTGAGTLRLAGSDSNTYGGSTTIEQGVLELAKPDNVTAITGPIVIGNNTDPAGSATLRNLASNQLFGKPSVQINASGVYQVSNSSTAARTETIGALSGSGKLFLPFRPELTIDFASGLSTFTGAIDDPAPNASGNKRINKRGGGTQVFTADANYDGFLIPYEGELRVNGQIPNAPVSIEGGTLSGTGRVANIDVSSGTIRPGSGSGGTLTANSVRMGFGPQTKVLIDMASASSGGFGKLNVQSVLDPNAGLDPARIEVNPIGGYVPPLGTTVEIINKSSGGPATSRFRNRSVAAGAHNMAVSYSGGDGNDVTLTAAKTLDVDGDGEYSATTDGLLISRFIGGITSGTALTANAVAASNGAKRTTQTDVAAYLTHLGNALNVSQNTSIDSVDGILILRWLLGFRDTALVTGLAIPPGSTAEQYADQIRNLLEQVTP